MLTTRVKATINLYAKLSKRDGELNMSVSVIQILY